MSNNESGVPVVSKVDSTEATGEERVQVKVMGNNSSAVAGAVAESQQIVESSGQALVEANQDTAADLNATVVASQLDVDDLTFVDDKVDASGSQNVEAVQTAHDDLNCNANLQVGNVDVAAGNPVPVTITDESETGVDVHDFKTAAAVVKNASDTHTYTVPALKVFHLKAIHCNASAAAHIEIKWGPAASEATHSWRFLRGGGDNDDFVFSRSVELAAVQNVLVIITNKDNKAQDLHSLIEGYLTDV